MVRECRRHFPWEPAIKVLAKPSDYMDRLAKETIDMRPHDNNIRREEVFKHSKTWNPTAGLLKRSRRS
jgi:hypothetical protein